jgi:flavin-dependent dehydrogenase
VIDLLVAGGGPAGLATALRAARAGLAVTVVEPRDGDIDKACGEGLMPHTVRQLAALGVPVAGRPLRGISYLDGQRQVQARFRSGTGQGVRRTALHAALADAARTAGVCTVIGSVGEITQSGDSVRAGGWQARYLAAADGLHSPIRRQLGLARPDRGARRWGIRRHIQIRPWSDYVEVHWAEGAEAYVTPISDECVGIAVLSSRRGGFDDQLARFGALRERTEGRPHGDDRAAGPLRQRVRGRAAGRVMLVGDAAGYVDALTGEGLGVAFAAADLLVRSVLADDPGDYDRQWRAMSRRYRLLTAGLLQASAQPALRRWVVPAAVTFPRVYAGIVNQLAE